LLLSCILHCLPVRPSLGLPISFHFILVHGKRRKKVCTFQVIACYSDIPVNW
jgi:hypothetical protein